MKTVLFPTIISMLLLVSIISHAQGIKKTSNTYSVSRAETLHINMRLLWEDHVMWTRNVIFCLVDELPGKDQAVKRLLQNQVDIGNAIIPYYGEDAGKKLTALLSQHISISAEVIQAAIEGNIEVFDEIVKKWGNNANQTAVLLSNINSNWKYADLKKMMDEHLKLTTEEVAQRIKKDYDADILAFDRVHNEIVLMSDMLAEGIVKQFPEKFKTITAKKVSK